MNKEKQKENNDKKRQLIKKIIAVIIIIIIILLLNTSCTSKFFGKIGKFLHDSFFYPIDESSSKIYNKELKFVKQEGTTTVDDIYKIEFEYGNLDRKKVSCTTSDEEIAVCFVKGNYVEVHPKKAGKVIISVIMNLNVKEYIGTHILNITKSKRKITFNEESGTIDLGETNTINIFYTLNDIPESAENSVSVSDKAIATATKENGYVMVRAKKEGTVTITLQIKYQGKTYKTTYKLTITNHANQEFIKSIEVSTGKLNPSFHSNITNYEMIVASSTKSISIFVTKASKITLDYYVNGKKVKNLNNISLNYGRNIVEIVAKTESGVSKKYSIYIHRKSPVTTTKSDINTLSELKINGYSLSPSFQADLCDYEVKITDNASIISMVTQLTSPTSTVEYRLNNNVIYNLQNMKLHEGKNIIAITVTSESGKKRVYTVTVIVPVYKIVIDKSIKEFYIENKTMDIPYQIYEDNHIKANYNIKGLKVNILNYKGKIDVKKGKITLTPSIKDINQTYQVMIQYYDKKGTTSVHITKEDYYIYSSVEEYQFNYVGKEEVYHLVLNTNLFKQNILSKEIENGIRLYNDIGYIDITSSNPEIVKIENDEDNEQMSNYITFLAHILNAGDTTIDIKGNILGEEYPSKTINIRVNRKYKVILNALDGFFENDIQKQELLFGKNELLKLSQYKAYKEDTSKDCYYYPLDSYNTSSDGTGTKYSVSDEILVTDNLVLYAIYQTNSSPMDITEHFEKYITDIDLFYHEIPWETKENIIYPGASGSYTVNLKNTTDSKIRITNINMQENTVCIPDLGCLNIGYIVKYTKPNKDNWLYYYGNNNQYQILNQDSESIKIEDFQNKIILPTASSSNKDSIELEPDEEASIAFLWKWVEANDALDSAIGSKKEDQFYSVSISIEYDKIKSNCKLESKQDNVKDKN